MFYLIHCQQIQAMQQLSDQIVEKMAKSEALGKFAFVIELS